MQRASPTSSPQKSPSVSKRASFENFENIVVSEAPKENAIVRLLVTPITFISFLISLFLIDAHNHGLRQHSHPQPPPAPPTTILGKIKAFFHHLVFKPASFSSNSSASPYAYVQSPVNEKVGVVSEDEFQVKKVGDAKGEERWYWRTKQKKMMRAEVADAFKIRKWVVGFLVFSGIGFVVLGLEVGGWLLGVVGGLFLGGSGENRLGKDW